MCIYICIYHQKKSERSEFWSNLLRNKLVLEGFPNPKPWLQRGSSAFFHPSSHCRHLLEVRTMLFVLLKLSLAPKNQHGTWDVYEMEHIHLHGLVSLWLCILQIGKDSIKVPMLKVTSMLPRLPPLLQSNIQGRPEVRLLHTCLLAGRHPTEHLPPYGTFWYAFMTSKPFQSYWDISNC